MKTFTLLTVILACVMGISVTSCKKNEAVQVPELLEHSFQDSEPEVQQAMQSVAASLQAGNYTEATRTLAPMISGRPLTEAQKQAVSGALVQINQAIAADPSLDTKEMYEMRARMFHAVHGKD